MISWLKLKTYFRDLILIKNIAMCIGLSKLNFLITFKDFSGLYTSRQGFINALLLRSAFKLKIQS